MKPISLASHRLLPGLTLAFGPLVIITKSWRSSRIPLGHINILRSAFQREKMNHSAPFQYKLRGEGQEMMPQ